MGIMKWLRGTFIPKPKRDVFLCLHCHTISKGQWCLNEKCKSKPRSGCYYDEYGCVGKQSARLFRE